ncbi:M131R [Myxoma virus]|nr:m131R [Myxoma virus]WLM68585.1 M131R [Myxoma virus]WNN27012.1 M131R [Myxoma virus]
MNNRACPRYYEFNKVKYKAVCMLRGKDVKGVYISSSYKTT